MADPGSGIIGGLGQVGQATGVATTNPYLAIAGEVVGSLLSTPQGNAQGGVLFTSPISVNVNTGEGDIDGSDPISSVFKTLIFVLGGIIVARQFRPPKAKPKKAAKK